MKKVSKRLFIGKSGQATVEFALVLPVFALIFLGTIEFGRLWETVNVLTSAAREGARVAAITSPNTSQVQTAVLNVLSSSSIANPTISISGPNWLNEVSVSVQATYQPLTGGLIPGINQIRLTRSTTMHWEG